MSDGKNKPASQKKPGVRQEASQYSLGRVPGLLTNKSTSAKTAKLESDRLKKYKESVQRLQLSRKLDARKVVLNKLTEQECFSSTQILGVKGNDKKWICSTINQLIWKEHKHAVQESEVRVFIEGAEVSNYLRESISWTIQGTGGMNTCSFTLNNNHDAFVITPQNVCSHINSTGWRLSKSKEGRLYTSPYRASRDTDENAKYVIYRNKAKRVFPPDGNKKNKNPQIDETGMWVYPLGPYRPIFHKHDCVRVFYRLPHISGVGKTWKRRGVEISRGAEAWAPAFTGFIDEYDMEDDPVSGDRKINIRCYDFRGILERMRVRILGTGLTSSSQNKDSSQSPIHAQALNEAKKAKASSDKNNPNKDKEYIDVTDRLGINRDLNILFNKVTQSRIFLKCNQSSSDGGFDKNCVANIYDETLTEYADRVSKLKFLWKNLDKSVQASNENDGRNRKYEREENGLVKITAQQSGTEDIFNQIPKAVKLIQTIGPVVEQYAVSYYAAVINAIDRTVLPAGGRARAAKDGYYPNQDFSGTASHSNLSKLPGKGAFLGKTVNIYQTSEIKAVDSDLKSKHPNIYKEASIEIALPNASSTEPNSIDRIYLLQQYILRKVQALFSGASDKIKEVIDRQVKEATGGARTLLRKQSFGGGVGAEVTFDYVSFVAPGTYQKVIQGLNNYKTSTQVQTNRNAKLDIDQDLNEFNNALREILDKLNRVFAELRRQFREKPDLLRRAKLLDIVETHNEAYTGGLSNAMKKAEGSSLAQLLATDAKFGVVQSGIYADLARAIEKDSHPLAGMSFEEAITWLTTVQSTINVGLSERIAKYTPGILQSWNLRMVFGIIGRSLTPSEVTLFGEQCVTEAKRDDAPLSPLHMFMHMLLPQKGTGAQTLVQQDITANAAAERAYTWETRLALINSLCETLDYQFYVTPIGDLAFEFPNYSALPMDFGKIFQGAYTASLGIRSFRCTEETGECNTGWVLTGNENEKVLNDITGSGIVKEKFQKQVIVADILARRIGVKVRKLEVPIPGIGSIMNGSVQRGLSSILAYGLLEIQRELGRMSQFSVQHEFRPYLLPNRPFHVVHRQRIGLARSVSYTMSPPMGACDVSSDMYYVRALHEDGTFRHIAGGHRLPVDYSGLFTGQIRQVVKYGATPQKPMPLRPDEYIESDQIRNAVLQTQGRRNPKDRTNWSCAPYLQDRYVESSAFYHDQVGNQFKSSGQGYTSYTSGSGGSSGSTPPTTRTNTGYLASRNWTKADNDGQPDSSIDTRRTGIRINEKGEDKSSKQKPNTLGNLYNPWPYGLFLGKGKTRYFNQWGFFRMLIPSERTKRGGPDSKWSEPNSWRHKGKLTGWHGGVDFYKGIDVGTEAYTPIALQGISTILFSGYKGAGSKTEWVSYPIGATVSGVPPLIQKFGIISKNGGFISKNSSQSGYLSFLVDAAAMNMYDKIVKEGRKYKKNFDIRVLNGVSPKSGLVVQGFGVVSMPGDPNRKLACRLRYVHTSAPAKSGKNLLYGSYKGYSPQHNQAPADSLLCYTGTSGTSQPHLHFTMEVYPPGQEPSVLKGQTDPSAWKELQKTNAQFLRTQVKIKLTAGYGVNSGKFSEEWKEYFKKKNKYAGANITTIDQAVDYLIKTDTAFRDNWARAIGEKGRMETNPLFFFKPEQIIKKMASKYNDYKKTWGDIYIDISGDNQASSICGKTNNLNQQKIALEYSSCLGKARRLVPRLRKTARVQCKEKREAAKRGSKVKVTQRKRDQSEKVAIKLDAKVKDETTKPNSRLRSDS